MKKMLIATALGIASMSSFAQVATWHSDTMAAEPAMSMKHDMQKHQLNKMDHSPKMGVIETEVPAKPAVAPEVKMEKEMPCMDGKMENGYKTPHLVPKHKKIRG